MSSSPPFFPSEAELEPAGWVPDSTLCSSSRKELRKPSPQCSRSVSEHTHTYTWLLRASCWRGKAPKHTKVSVGFKFIFNHIKSNLENWCMGFSESPELFRRLQMHREGRNLSWHGQRFPTRAKMISFLSLEWRSFKIYKNILVNPNIHSKYTWYIWRMTLNGEVKKSSFWKKFIF